MRKLKSSSLLHRLVVTLLWLSCLWFKVPVDIWDVDNLKNAYYRERFSNTFIILANKLLNDFSLIRVQGQIVKKWCTIRFHRYADSLLVDSTSICSKGVIYQNIDDVDNVFIIFSFAYTMGFNKVGIKTVNREMEISTLYRRRYICIGDTLKRCSSLKCGIVVYEVGKANV